MNEIVNGWVDGWMDEEWQWEVGGDAVKTEESGWGMRAGDCLPAHE